MLQDQLALHPMGGGNMSNFNQLVHKCYLGQKAKTSEMIKLVIPGIIWPFPLSGDWKRKKPLSGLFHWNIVSIILPSVRCLPCAPYGGEAHRGDHRDGSWQLLPGAGGF
jgi:hypothetical protein